MVGVRESSTSVVELLLERGARLGGEDLSGRNILHYTALHGDRQIMNILLHANLEGIDAHALDKDGNTPLDCFIHHRANFVPRPVEGSTDEDERRAFKALLARAGSSRVEEMYEERSRGGDDGDEDSDEKDSARSSSYDSFTDDDDHVKGGSPSDSRSDTPTQHPDLEEDIFFDAEETLPSP
ncbi:MAG: hypothetical protein M1815_005505 [Lichina confinis]|nr:MAG: hypothetical protein M1815_005505 [Lichina confinis]